MQLNPEIACVVLCVGITAWTTLILGFSWLFGLQAGAYSARPLGEDESPDVRYPPRAPPGARSGELPVWKREGYPFNVGYTPVTPPDYAPRRDRWVLKEPGGARSGEWRPPQYRGEETPSS